MKKAEYFLTGHKLRAADIDIEDLVKIFTEDMTAGLAGKEGALRMIPTYIEADNDFITDTPVLAIDAGGTNFRASIITFTGSGKVVTGETVSYRMPGLDGEISSKEFFKTIADYIRPHAGKVERIGFFFSYPTEILPDRDGRLIQFCKEVQAHQVEGQVIGKNLLASLGTPEKKIVLLNDTVATLLAGKSAYSGRSYDSFLGFILGTGTNTCYIEKNYNIIKNKDLNQERSQIINIESGDFRRPPGTDLDILFDQTTINPGSYKFEKMFSGGYFGGLSLFVLKTAAEEGVFSDQTAKRILGIDHLTSGEANSYTANQAERGNRLSESIRESNDSQNCRLILDTLTDRASKLVAASMAAVVLKSGKGKSHEKPILITVEGTTFYKLHNFRPRFEMYFNEYLSGDRKRYVEFTEVEKSSLLGAALAALID
ncbi:MAG: hexokinase [Bacteroidales bacterium]|nr:hexokinase [Bacteroidales bacterium]